MIQFSDSVQKTFSQRLAAQRVPGKYRGFYAKWLQCYLDVCGNHYQLLLVEYFLVSEEMESSTAI